MTQLPVRYADIAGQEDALARLNAFSEFYRKNGSKPEHILIIGDEGMGKRTIATAFANELGASWQEAIPSQFQIKGDLTATLTNLRENQVLILRDVHKLKPILRDVLLEPLRTNKLSIQIGERLHVMGG
jgi:Holliday junction resolvasome RuvABC ATP-dependent DNA helicase subunit